MTPVVFKKRVNETDTARMWALFCARRYVLFVTKTCNGRPNIKRTPLRLYRAIVSYSLGSRNQRECAEYIGVTPTQFGFYIRRYMSYSKIHYSKLLLNRHHLQAVMFAESFLHGVNK